MTIEEKERLHWELVELIQRACDPEAHQIVYDKSKAFLAENLDDSDAHFLFGIGAYWVSYVNHEALREAETAFQKCLALGPIEWDRQMTIYHLGFIFFRQKRYQETIDLLNGRSADFFASIDQFWRIPKLDEVELACRYYLQPDDLSLTAAEALEQQYGRCEDLIMAPLLIEIGDCLSELLKSRSQEDSRLNQICDVIVRTIQHLGQTDTLKKREGRFFLHLN